MVTGFDKARVFDQKIVDGYQVELPEQWLRHGNVWEVKRADSAVAVNFGGRLNPSLKKED